MQYIYHNFWKEVIVKYSLLCKRSEQEAVAGNWFQIVETWKEEYIQLTRTSKDINLY